MENNNSDFLTADEILKRGKLSETNFSFKSKLMVIRQEQRTDRNLKPYLQLKLQDITGKIETAKRWFINEEIFLKDRFELDIGNVIELTGEYQPGYSSVTIQDYKSLEENKYKIEDFKKVIEVNKEDLINKLESTINSIKNPFYKELLEKIFNDKVIRNKFIILPSSVGSHHAYENGNLEHTINMVKIFEYLANIYNEDTLLDIDLIYTGILLHDIAKIKEYNLKNGFPIYIGFNPPGHLLEGKELVEKYIKEIESFPKNLENRLIHLIISHHGKKEWGAIVEPETPEAEMLHLLDMIDSRFKLTY